MYRRRDFEKWKNSRGSRVLNPRPRGSLLAVIHLSHSSSRQPCFEQPSEARLPRDNRVLYIMNINNQLPANRVDPVV